ncbi:MAG: PA14 domain-containing protein [Verrucomicrobia bacterium]|nr:PA14 domain-containing protein [Verrucomicrobiota bacterium]
MKTLRHNRILLGWFMTVLVFVMQVATPLQSATFYWAPDIGFGADPQEGGNWNTTGTNWWLGDNDTSIGSTLTTPMGATTWSSPGNHTAVFGSAGVGPTLVGITSPVTVGGLVFDANGVFLNAASATDSLTFAGGSPTITIKGDSAGADTAVAINAALAGTNGLSIVFDDASGYTGSTGYAVLTLGSGGNSYASTLSGGNGITVGQKVILSVDVASSDLIANRNPLGSNKITLQSDSELNILGSSNTTSGLSGRVFATSGTGNSSRVDFTATATGVAVPGGFGTLGLPATATNIVSSLNGNGAATSIQYLDSNSATQTVSNYAVQWVGQVNIGAAGAYTFFSNSDDGSRIFIDGNLILNKDGSTGDLSSAPIFLAAGRHDIRIDYVQGGGGANINLGYAGTELGSAQIRTIIPNGSLKQADVNTPEGSSTALQLGNAVHLTGNALISLSDTDFTSVQLGRLILNKGVTLSVDSYDLLGNTVVGNGAGFGKTLRLGGTTGAPTIFGTPGSVPDLLTDIVTIASDMNVAFDGVVSDEGRAMTIRKEGGGWLSFNQTSSANSLVAGTSIQMIGQTASKTATTTAGDNFFSVTDATGLSVGMTVAGTGVPAGAVVTGISGLNVTISGDVTVSGAPTLAFAKTPTLVLTGSSAAGASNPIGSAGIMLNRGNLVLDSKGATAAGNGPVFNNQVTVSQNAVIQSVANASTLTLGSASRGISIAAGKTLVLDAIAGGISATDPGANLIIAGGITGDNTTSLIIRSTLKNAVTTLSAVNALANGVVQQTGFASLSGVVTLTGNNAGFNGALNFEPGSNLRLEGVSSLSGKSFTMAGGTLQMLDDGDGSGGAQNFAFNHAISLTGNATLAVGRTATSQAPYYTQAANKLAQITSLSTGRQTVTVANNNGYGLQVTGATTLTGTPTFTVNNANSSNLVTGLQLTGQVTGQASLLKNGGGTLLLGNNTNSFGGPVIFSAFGSGSTLTVESVAKLVAGQRLTGTNINAGTSVNAINVQNFAASVANGGTVLTLGVAIDTLFTAGMPVSGTGIPTGTKVAVGGVNNNVTNTTAGLVNGATPNIVTNVQGGTASFRVGMPVTGNGIPAGTYVAEIFINGTDLRLSQDITQNNPTLVRRQLTLDTPVTVADPTLVLSQLALNQALAGATGTVNANSMVNVSAGVLAFTGSGSGVGTNDSLGNSTNQILSNTNSATVGLRAEGTYTTTREFIMNQQNNSFEVTAVNMLTMNSAFTFANANFDLQKNNRGTLLLTQAQTGWNGNLTVGQGVLRISNAAALGNAGSFNLGTGVATSATLIANVAAALELTGDITSSEALVFTPGNNNTSNGIDGAGALRSLSGTNIWNGSITFSGATSGDSTNRAATIGVDSGSSLTINGVMTAQVGTGGGSRGAWFGLVGAGNGTITSALNYTGNLSFGASSLVKAGSGTWTLTSANAFNGQSLFVNQGVLAVASTLGVPGTNGGAGTVFVTPGGTLLLGNNNGTLTNQVNSATNSNTVTLTSAAPANLIVGAALLGSTVTSISANRLTVRLAANANANLTAGSANFTFANLDNRLSNHLLNLYGGVLTYNGSSTATSTETTTGTLTLNPGHSIITLATGTGQQLNFTTGAVTRNSGSTVLFRGSNLGGAAGASTATIQATGAGYVFVGQAGGAGTTNKGILPYAIIDATAGGSGTSFATADTVNGLLRPLAAGEMVTTLTNNLGGVATPLNVSLSTVGSVSNALTANTMTVNSLTLNSSGGTSAQSAQTLILDSGGVLAFSGNAGISGGRLSTSSNRQFLFHTLGDLTVTAAMTGNAGGLTKAGAGVMTLSTQQFYSGVTVVNQGTLRLNGGTNTIFYNNDFLLQGGSLDLNGTAQTLNALRFDTAVAQNANFTPGMGGSVINSSGSQATLGVVNGGSFSGTITGNVALVRSTSAGGFSDWNIYTANSYTGATILNGGRTQLLGTATLGSTSDAWRHARVPCAFRHRRHRGFRCADVGRGQQHHQCGRTWHGHQ